MFPANFPPISNKALYAYRVFAKWLSYFIFGLGSVIFTIVFLPFMRIIFHPKKRFQKHARHFISYSMRVFISIMHALKFLDLNVESKEIFRTLSSKIIVANHPSILDVVMLLALIPNANCIVNTYLNNSILRVVVRNLFILNSLDIQELFNECSESLEFGNCIIIFPEGTRTPRDKKVILKKGAARIAIACGCNIVPVHIGGTDKFGLGKKDPWTGFNPTDKYVYKLSMGDEIIPDKYNSLSTPAAVRAITLDIKAFLFPNNDSKQI